MGNNWSLTNWGGQTLGRREGKQRACQVLKEKSKQPKPFSLVFATYLQKLSNFSKSFLKME